MLSKASISVLTLAALEDLDLRSVDIINGKSNTLSLPFDKRRCVNYCACLHRCHDYCFTFQCKIGLNCCETLKELQTKKSRGDFMAPQHRDHLSPCKNGQISRQYQVCWILMDMPNMHLSAKDCPTVRAECFNTVDACNVPSLYLPKHCLYMYAAIPVLAKCTGQLQNICSVI